VSLYEERLGTTNVDIQPNLLKSCPHGLWSDFREVDLVGLEISGIGSMVSSKKMGSIVDIVVSEFLWVTWFLTNTLKLLVSS
jgi:hypothetical protein